MRTHKEKTLHFPILIEQDEDNFYIVSCPSFEGCHSYGKTIDEALKNIQEVIEICLDEVHEKKKRSIALNRFIGFRELQLPFHTATVKA
jgi:predicted RNase H-like HicB family nuclease